MVKLYDVAPGGTAVTINEQVAAVTPGRTSLEMKASDWRLPAGQLLAVQIGAIEGGAVSDWIDTPSNQTISVDGVRLELALDDPADDRATPGARAPYLDGYLAYSAATLPAGSPSFTVPTGRD